MKRCQVYLNHQSIKTIDELSGLNKDLSRSEIIRQAVDAAAGRIGQLLAEMKVETTANYAVFDDLIDSVEIKTSKQVKVSQDVDKIYYQ